MGIIRISGPNARGILHAVARGLPQDPIPHRLYYTRFWDDSGQTIDDGYAVWFPGPRTYTAEDVAELQGHGGAANLQRLLRATIRAGARLAERGEFTLRAFLNGRLDLAQAEAVMEVVKARTETALDLAHDQLRGGLSEEVRRLRSAVVDVLTRLEVQIDFIDEDLGEVHGERPTAAIVAARADTEALARTFTRGQVLRDGARVVLLGPPNAGKSSLFNALLRRSRAIVTDIPGTTRDFLEETADLGGVPVVLIDTAGVRDDAADVVEAAGVERSLALAQSADLILLLSDADEPPPIPEGLNPERVLPLRTKADLGGGDVSVVTGAGLDTLIAAITERLLPEGAEEADRAVVTSARHHEALQAAAEALGHAEAACAAGEPAELVAVDVQEALVQLGLIVGETTSEDLLDRIFAEFCIGK